MEVLRFALLGLGAGAVYALTAQGVVLVYRGSGVLNFAQGAVGMLGAFAFYLWRDHLATPVALVAALGLGGAIGIAIHLVVMRPLRRAPALARLIATLGLLTLFLAIGLERWGDSARIVPKLLPVDGVEVLPDIIIGRDRLIILAIVVALTVVLTGVYRWTRFGLATTAVAENRRATAAAGVSPDMVAALNWGLGCALAVFGAVLIVNLTGLSVTNLALLVVPAFAAALVGGFRSFGLTLAGGLLIGILESEIALLQTKVDDPSSLQGWGRSVPFLVIIVVLAARGRALPLRSETAERPPKLGTGRVDLRVVAPVSAGALVLIAFVASDRVAEAVTMTAAIAIVALSLTVVTGYTGQLSLAQFALAGMGAWFATRMVVNYDVPFELAAIVGIAGAVPIGLLVGLPALRSRGVNLAVATLGLALVLESLVLNNSKRTGGITGTQIGTSTFFGVDLDTVAHPERYAVLAAACFIVIALLVANLRRGSAGRRLVAVRTNERAAAALGISVVGAKLYAFGLSAAIAATGGVLLAYRRPSVVFYPTFGILESIFVVVYSVIGGVGYLLGSIIGASLDPGALVPTIGDSLLSSRPLTQFLTAVLLVVVLMWIPNGLASIDVRRLARRMHRRSAPTLPSIELSREAVDHVTPLVLGARGVTVRFGSVTAVQRVDLTIAPGQVVGLIGPNGAGKTTLIDVLTGFARPVEGVVELDGVDITRWSPRRRAAAGIGRSFQSLELFESMTVADNLRTAADPRGRLGFLRDLVRPRDVPLGAVASAAVREFGLEVDLGRLPDELSYGRRRLVAIARAVAARPSVLLLDEPAAGLGDTDTVELGRLIRRLADEWGIAVLLVEHDMSLVHQVCDRLVVVDFGAKIADGPVEDVRRDPRVVAAYLGSADTARSELAGSEVAGSEVAGAPPTTTPRRSALRTSEAPLVSARGLQAGYGGVPALHGLDLEVFRGEVVALLGANGAGKTTTLLTLAGELHPTQGSLVHDVSLRGRPTLHRLARAGVALVPEERAILRTLTVRENLRVAKVPVERALELFPELGSLLRRPAGLLSGGEQQMLSLARALARGPRLLLVDELSLGLAPLIVERLLLAVRAAADDGVGVMLVEQHARMALGVADRVYVLRRGAVLLSGSADAVAADFGSVERAYLDRSPTDPTRPDPTRPDPTRPDPTRPDPTRPDLSGADARPGALN